MNEEQNIQGGAPTPEVTETAPSAPAEEAPVETATAPETPSEAAPEVPAEGGEAVV